MGDLRETYPEIGIHFNTPQSNAVGDTWLILSPAKIPFNRANCFQTNDEGRIQASILPFPQPTGSKREIRAYAYRNAQSCVLLLTDVDVSSSMIVG